MDDHRLPSPPLPGREGPDPARLGAEAGRVGWLALALALAFGACSTDFDPYAEGPPFFALSADVDTREDTLFVRVQDLAIPPGAEPAPLDARVTLEDQSTGVVVALRDSLTRLSEGGIGHLFWTTEPLFTGRTYTLAAERADDPSAVSSVEISFPTARVLPRLADTDTLTTRPLQFAGTLVTSEPVRIEYDGFRTDTGASTTIRKTYFLVNATQEVRVPLEFVAGDLRRSLGLDLINPESPIVLTDARATYVAFSISPIQVQNGIGSVVWTAQFSADWHIPTLALEYAGIQDGQDE